ncbi:hypothetical protein [Falsiroseomonas sp.]|uniref:hypothetical protein n=1 Tax=Falsiroseomonas sp. TaxID=2870721 RepID=UPI0035656944
MPIVTRYVSEREYVFSPNVLGFPSIQGCHAVVYVTDGGLFGFHNAGGEMPDKYGPRAAAFAAFVAGHPSGGAPGRAIYCACYATPRNSGSGNFSVRAYPQPRKEAWTAEAAAFAAAVGFTNGPIYGFDFGQSDHTGLSAYSEFARTGATCVIQVKPWSEADKTTAVNTDHVNIQYLSGNGPGLTNQTRTTITAVNPAGLKTVYPERLR